MKYPITIIATLLTVVPMTARHRPTRRTAKEIFDQMCAGCHGTYGDGQEGTRRAGSCRVSARSPTRNTWPACPTSISSLIIKKGGAYMGKIAAMPAWEQTLSDEEIRGTRRPYPHVLLRTGR